jgi:hypothetical protein
MVIIATLIKDAPEDCRKDGENKTVKIKLLRTKTIKIEISRWCSRTTKREGPGERPQNALSPGRDGQNQAGQAVKAQQEPRKK